MTFKLEMETIFQKLNKYDVDHIDNLRISSNHNRNLSNSYIFCKVILRIQNQNTSSAFFLHLQI